jgi:hypothetical protein
MESQCMQFCSFRIYRRQIIQSVNQWDVIASTSFPKAFPTQLNPTYANVGSEDLCYFSLVTADVRLIDVCRDNGRNSLNAAVHLFDGPDGDAVSFLSYHQIIIFVFHPFSPQVRHRVIQHTYMEKYYCFHPLLNIAWLAPRDAVCQTLL